MTISLSSCVKSTRTILSIAVLLLAVSPLLAAPSPRGLWDAVVVTNKVEIPFRFEISESGGEVHGFFFEGDRKAGSTSGSFKNGTLKFEYDYLNTVLEATFKGDRLDG